MAVRTCMALAAGGRVEADGKAGLGEQVEMPRALRIQRQPHLRGRKLLAGETVVAQVGKRKFARIRIA